MRGRRRILIAVAVVLVGVVVSYFLFVSERERQLAVDDVGSEPLDVESTALEEQNLGETEVRVYLYRAGAVNPDSGFLGSTSRTVFETDDEQLMARQVVLEVLKSRQLGISQDPATGAAQSRPYPDRARLRSLYILEDGTAVVDLSSDVVEGLPGGITSELAIIRSITRSLRANIQPVTQVRFLVDGEARETLAGHVSIAHPFR